MSTEQEMQRLQGRIAEVFAHREHLKQALERGALAPRAGFAQLETTDRELSDLDTRFKTLWDAVHAASHPASRQAGQMAFEPRHLDCATAIMLDLETAVGRTWSRC